MVARISNEWWDLTDGRAGVGVDVEAQAGEEEKVANQGKRAESVSQAKSRSTPPQALNTLNPVVDLQPASKGRLKPPKWA